MQPSAAVTAEQTDPAAEALRKAVIGDRVTIEQAAQAFGVTTRSIYNAIARHRIPFVRAFGTRFLAPDDLRRCLLAEGNAAPRGRGRPRKHAA